MTGIDFTFHVTIATVDVSPYKILWRFHEKVLWLAMKYFNPVESL